MHARDQQAATYGDRVDGVGIAVIVAVVVVLAPIATGHHKDAPKALAASDHPMLQGSLRSKMSGQLRSSQEDSYLPCLSSSPPLLERKEKKAQSHWAWRRLKMDSRRAGSCLLIKKGGARNGEPSTKSKQSHSTGPFLRLSPKPPTPGQEGSSGKEVAGLQGIGLAQQMGWGRTTCSSS